VEIDDNAQSSALHLIAAEYRDRSTRFAGRAAQLAKYVRLASSGRLVTFCAAVGCLVLAFGGRHTYLLASGTRDCAAWARWAGRVLFAESPVLPG